MKETLVAEEAIQGGGDYSREETISGNTVYVLALSCRAKWIRNKLQCDFIPS